MKQSAIVAASERRAFLRRAASAAGVVLASCATTSGARTGAGSEEKEALVTPGEDLMQEHGLLERVLLVYEEAARRIDANEALDLGLVASGADIVKRFVESYHEKLEEQFVFPRLRTANREVPLVDTLLRQHERGREVTAEILRRASGNAKAELALALRSFVRMYRPHAAREDTVLIPAFRDVVGRAGYQELGEQFEDEEHKRFGEDGFSNMVAQVVRIEAALNINELASFTPP